MILGIDPGAKGALAFFDMDSGRLEIFDMPTVQVKRGAKLKTEVSPQMLSAIIKANPARKAVLEKVGAMPGQGVSSMFQFGRSVGILEGVLAACGVPVDYVSPAKWQRELSVREGKDGNRQRACELFPAYIDKFARVKDDGRADAALIAYYGALK